MALSKKFIRTTLISGIKFASVRISSLVYLMIMARWLSKSDMGIIVSLGIGIVLIPKVVIDWLGWIMQQKSLSVADENLSRNIISEISYNILLVGFIFCPFLAILYLFLMNIHFPSTLGFLFLLVVSLEVPVQLFLNVEAAKLNLEFRIIIILLLAILNYVQAIFLYFIFNSIEFILVAWILTEIIVFLILLYRNWTIFHGRTRFLGTRYIFKFGIPVFFLFLFKKLSSTIDRIVIGAFLDQETLAIYHLTYRIIDIFVQGILTITIAIIPIIMKLESLNIKRSQLVFIGSLKTVSLMILAIFPILIMFPRFVITIILGEKYMPGASLLSILSIVAILDIISTINIQFRGAKGETKVMLNYALCYFFPQLLALLILFRFGVMGIAFSRAFGGIISFVYIIGTSSLIKKMPRTFYGKVLLLIASIGLTLWITTQYLHMIIALTVSIGVLLFVSSVFRYYSEEELNAIARGLPSEVQPLFLIYRRIENFFSFEEPKMD